MRLREVRSLRRLFTRALETDFSYFPKKHIVQVKRDNTTTKFVRAMASRHRILMVAVQHGKLVGFAISSTHQDKLGHLYWLYVRPELRNRKVGKQLLDRTLEEMRHRHMTGMELVTHNFEGYYAKNGFWQRGLVHQNGTDLYVMQYDFPDNQISRPRNIGRWVIRWPFWAGLLAAVGGIMYVRLAMPDFAYQVPGLILPPAKPQPGSIVQITQREHYSAGQVTALARQNYGPSFMESTLGVTRIQFQYRTTDQDGSLIIDYATAYIPDDTKDAPVIAMAPGTTGLTAACAVSVEQPQVHNWANYQSHLMAYAAKGYTGIITDYNDMRGAKPGQVQPYLVGEMEGRALLDSIRALKRLPDARAASDFNHTFTAGYSQGGHAILWADHLRVSYAPDVKLAGDIAWGGVLDIGTTWGGITSGSTLVWFGPYILASYGHFYAHDYQINNILLPPWNLRLEHDATNHCIDTDIPFYGVRPDLIYTQQFLSDLKAGIFPSDRYGLLGADLTANNVPGTTKTPKLINQGAKDNVVLASEQPAAIDKLCQGGGPIDYAVYGDVTHYNLMVQSFVSTLGWMQDVIHDRPLRDTCPTLSPTPTPSPVSGAGLSTPSP